MDHSSTLRAMAFFFTILAFLLLSVNCQSMGEQAEQGKDSLMDVGHYGSAKAGEAMDAIKLDTPQTADEAQRSSKGITGKGMDAAQAMKHKSSDAYEKAKQKAHGAYQKVQSFASDASKGAGDLGKKAGDKVTTAKEKFTGYGSDATNKGANSVADTFKQVKDDREL